MATLDIDGLEVLLKDLGMETTIPQYKAANVLNKPLDIGRSYLADILGSLVETDPTNAYNSISWPGDIFSGDLAVTLPKFSHGADPDVVALDLMKRFPKCPLFLLPFPEGVHLRILFSPWTLPHILFPYINDRKDSYGRDVTLGLKDPVSPDLGPKKIVVEFSSPNIASEFQGKHLRSTILGAFISNLYQAMGWEVVKLNYLGDWGKPIGLLGVGWEKFGSEEQFQNDPSEHLLEIYNKINELFAPEQAASKTARDEKKDTAEIESQGLFAERNAFFKRLEDGEETAVAFWKRVRDVNIENFTKFYSRLNVSFDEYSGESQVRPETMAEVQEILKSKGLFEEEEENGGASIINLKKHGGMKSGAAIIRDRAGSSTYLLRDLAAVLERSRKYSFDKMIYVVAADQHKTHFARLFKILELMDLSDLASKLQYVNFNDVHLSNQPSHGHMFGEILDQFQTAMNKSLEADPAKAALLGESKDTIGITALLVQELSVRRASNHVSDITQSASFDSGTGPDLQYWYAKLCTILKANPGTLNLSDEDFAPLGKENPNNLLRLLIQYPDITHAAYRSLEPAPVLSYLVNVASQLSVCLKGTGDGNFGPAEAMLFESTRVVLENGMKLLGITPASGL